MDITYELQFNNDKESCLALMTMIKDGWTVQSGSGKDGHHFLVLTKFIPNAILQW